MFKQILSFKEISDLSQKKANLIKAYPANSYIRLGEMLINDNGNPVIKLTLLNIAFLVLVHLRLFSW